MKTRKPAAVRLFGGGASGKKRRYRNAVQVHFSDECPVIGSGRRWVVLIRQGRKHVRIADAATGTHTASLSRSAFERSITTTL